MTEELIEYIFCCLVYKHKHDDSPKITKEATEKENIL